MAFSSILYERVNYSFHHWWTDCVTNEFDLVSPSASFEQVFIRKPHSASKFWNLEHSQLIAVRRRTNVAKTIDRRYCSQGPVNSLPSPCSIRTVINNQERL